METQTELINTETVDSVETYEFEPIQGYPMLNWKGKRPLQPTQFYPAQLKETYGEEVDGWINKIYWGDNLQVMSHLLKTYRGQINLIYIDPPFDSKADYKKKIELKGKEVKNDRTAFEEKQYTDIWTNDEYLQFMYERIILMRELLADNGTIYLHCDPTASHYIKIIIDEVFGSDNFRNEIVWFYRSGGVSKKWFGRKHDIILFYVKAHHNDYVFNIQKERSYNRDNKPYRFKGVEEFEDEEGRWYTVVSMRDVWDIDMVGRTSSERLDYPTQKPEALIERIIKASSNPGDLVFDCFMGSGTTQAVAMKLGRRFIGADINLGAVETTSKRLFNLAKKIRINTAQEELDLQEGGETENIQTYYTGFEVYNVNNYDVFRNPKEAKDLLIEALEIQKLPSGSIYDGEKDGRKVKIMPINRIATRADLGELITSFNYQEFQRSQEEHPNAPVEKLLLVCMGHEPDLKAFLEAGVPNFELEIEVMDILRDKSKLEFKRDSEAKIVRSNGNLVIEEFYPMNLLQKLSIMKETVGYWGELVESVKIDFNYDSAVMNPTVIDSPEGEKLVKGSYTIPEDAGTIRVKITDLLSESLEMSVE